MDRTKIENVLMDMGVPAGNKGFSYIADAVEYIDAHGTDISVTKELYPAIAKKRGATPSRVERAIRHDFGIARSEKGNYDVVEKYIGFIYYTNYSTLVMLHKKIKQECEGINAERMVGNSENPIVGLTESDIRDIIRQELKLALDELRKRGGGLT